MNLKKMLENLGTFKLKDRANRNAVMLDFSKASRPMEQGERLWITKVPRVNNKIQVTIKWKEENPHEVSL